MLADKHMTVVGVATGTTDGGVAVIRLSGRDAKVFAESMVGRLGPQRVVSLRKLKGSDGSVLDEGLVVWMEGPNTFTGEDIVELHVHSGRLNVQQIVVQLMELGACGAGPGEFSRRAVENQRMTIDEAEGVAAVIASKTEEELGAARRLMAGEIGKEVDRVRQSLARLRIEVEAHLDFPDDVDSTSVCRWQKELAKVSEELQGWLDGFEAGQRRRQRKRVVIVGPPNVGKSALFNRLLQENRALISERAGTTRDYLESEWGLDRWMLQLVDTAGIRASSDDEIEIAGIQRSLEQIEAADVIVWVEAADCRDKSWAELNVELDASRTIYVENKRDLGALRKRWLGVSAVRGSGIAELRGQITQWVRNVEKDEVPMWIGLSRHRGCAEGALEALGRAKDGLAGQQLELVAFDIAQADLRLGEIVGKSGLGAVGEDILQGIFSTFCIGK